MRIPRVVLAQTPRGFRDVFDAEFEPTKAETLTWLSEQSLIVVPFKAGRSVS